MKQYEGKVVLITGGGRSIGKGISTAFAKEGANLVITGRTQSTLDEVKTEFEREYGIKVLPLVADGGNSEAVKHAINKTIETFGRLDVLINNAQTLVTNIKLEEQTEEQFKTNFETGPYAAFYYMKYAFPYLKESKGSVINFGSGAGQNGLVEFSSYNASKEAIRGLSRTAAAEWGPFGINVNVVCPVVMTENMKVWAETYPDIYQSTVIDKTPMRRVGDAEKDIGRICVFLGSEDAKFITGETINADGGTVLRP